MPHPQQPRPEAAVSEDIQVADFAIVDESVNGTGTKFAEVGEDTDEDRLLREIDSIKFYIDSGYLELADKAIGELRSEFGDRARDLRIGDASQT